MSNVKLVRLDPSLEQALANDAEDLEALVQGNWPRVADAVHRVVGSCAFKTPPTDEGTVEIAYFTYPGFEGRGYATKMARRLIELARTSAAVRRGIAHTLPETNASTRVLEKVGMTFGGAMMDPEDGPVWRWVAQVGV